MPVFTLVSRSQCASKRLARCCAVALILFAYRSHSAIDLDLSYVDMSSERFVRFKGWVDRAANGDPGYDFAGGDAALMYRLTGQASYCALAVQRAERQVAAAEMRIGAGQAPEAAAGSYLYAGPAIREVALAYDWCAAFTSPAQRMRWAAYAEQTVWNIWNHEQARWGANAFPWSGWSVSDPGNNYYFSFLEATMFWALASDSTTWRNDLTNVRLPLLRDYYAVFPGGGSREGTYYGTYHALLFELMRLWRDSTGVDLSGPHVAETQDFWIHGTVPTLDRVAPLGDQARASYPDMHDYHRAVLLHARAISDDAQTNSRAQWWLSNISTQRMTQGSSYIDDLLSPAAGGNAPTALHYHATGAGVLFARTNWTRDGLWMSFVAGPFDQSHAHQDQGAFTLFHRDFLAVTENIYTNSGIQQETPVHNVLRFELNGAIVRQRGDTVSTMAVTPGVNGALTVEADLTPAYAGNAAVGQWRRRLDFNSTRLRVHDTFAIGAGVQATFQVNTPVQPFVNGRTATAGSLLVTVIEPADATLSVLDWRTVDASEYDSGYRLDIRGSGNAFVVELACASSSCTPRAWPRPLLPRPRPPR